MAEPDPVEPAGKYKHPKAAKSKVVSKRLRLYEEGLYATPKRYMPPNAGRHDRRWNGNPMPRSTDDTSF